MTGELFMSVPTVNRHIHDHESLDGGFNVTRFTVQALTDYSSIIMCDPMDQAYDGQEL